MRRQAKVVNFATIYGATAFGISRQTDISMKDAAHFITRYFETYPKFQEYIDKTIAFAREHGYVETLCGRRRNLPDINAKAQFVREGAERVAMNTPLQGTVADIIKIAMITIHNTLLEKKLTSRMLLQVHDELVFEVADSEKEIMESLVRDQMQGAMNLSVPLIVDMGWGKSWGEAH
jgi:DNA polymerase-1